VEYARNTNVTRSFQKVNLFIVGAAKAGTTSLWKVLGSHPEIYTVNNDLHKEPAYFSNLGSNMGIKAYHRLFENGAECTYRLDASTAYLTSPESAERIYQYNPEARILIVLRNPVDRAYSLYCWMVASGYEWAPTFEKALELEEKRVHSKRPSFSMPQYYWNYMYKRSGNYSGQVKRYIDLFGDNVLLLSYHDLIRSPETLVTRIILHLNLQPLDHINFTNENPSRYVYDARLTFIIRKINNILNRLHSNDSVISINERDWLVLMTLKKQRPPPLNNTTRQMLMEYYRLEFEYFGSKYGISFQ